MSELLTGLITLGGVFLISQIKPELVLGGLLKLLKQKFKNHSNRIANSLGLKLIQFGTYALTFEEDDGTIEQETKKIKDSSDVIEGKIKK